MKVRNSASLRPLCIYYANQPLFGSLFYFVSFFDFYSTFKSVEFCQDYEEGQEPVLVESMKYGAATLRKLFCKDFWTDGVIIYPRTILPIGGSHKSLGNDSLFCAMKKQKHVLITNPFAEAFPFDRRKNAPDVHFLMENQDTCHFLFFIIIFLLLRRMGRL